jgi:hypothetical protein
VGTYEVAAMRQTFATTVVVGVTVQPRKTVQAPEIVLSLDAPVLDALSHGNGGAGTEVVLRGRNFGASKNTVLSVSFGATQATTFTRVSDTEIRVTVPQGALSGPVLVRSNGVASNALDFQVIASLSVKPYYAGLFVGDRQKFDVEAKDPLGTLVSAPNIRWELGAPMVGKLDAAGNFLGDGEGWSEIRAVSGAVEGLAAAAVTAWSLPARALDVDPNAEIAMKSLGVGPAGALVIADWEGHRVLLRPPEGGLRVLAGSGESGFSPDGTPALSARLYMPVGATLDAAGHLYFAETQNHRVRIVPAFDTTRFGRAMTAGCLYTIAGTGERGFNGDGPEAHTRRLSSPVKLLIEPDGSLIFVDRGNRRIRRISPSGAIDTLAGGGAHMLSGMEIEARQFGEAIGTNIARDAAGNLLVSTGASARGDRLLMLCRVPGRYFGIPMQAGTLYTVAGTPETGFNGDGPALETRLSQPEELAFLPDGDLVFVDSGGYLIRKLGKDGIVRTVAGRRLISGVLAEARMALPAPATDREISTDVMAVTARGGILIQTNAHVQSLVELQPR